MPAKRMTAHPAKPLRYRAGKPIAPEVSSESEGDELPDVEETELLHNATPPPPPKATSFPSEATRVARNLKQVDLNARQQRAAADEAARVRAQQAQRAKEEEGFVTEEEDEEESDVGDGLTRKKDDAESGGGEQGEEEEEEEDGDDDDGEESSDEEDEGPPRRGLPRPTFIKKDRRPPAAVPAIGTTTTAITAGLDPAEAQRRLDEARQEAADEVVADQIRRDAEARARGKQNWDDDEVLDEDGHAAVDDTDGLDPEAERAAWKLRELKRVKREREAIEQAEHAREEVERRRGLSAAAREAEDREHLARQQAEKESRGKMGYMQKYHHKGAFFQPDAEAHGLARRDLMGSRFQDEVANRELLPQYMQIRDMTKLGRKGRSKYKDLKTEDTGRLGVLDDPRRPPGDRGRDGDDHRFQPDRGTPRADAAGVTGANASVLGARQRPVEMEAAPDDAPRAMRPEPPHDPAPSESPANDHSHRHALDPSQRQAREHGRSQFRSDARHPHRSRSRSSSPPPRHRDRRPDDRDRYQDHHRDRRKRSPSPDRRRDDSDKRRRVGVT
ncbi:MAG: hypothetical protein M1826_004708 [Phylliscum demangeonii]|nr:MAG: hypothetical protein M1826_004708 [Phylliscum demangeonii]